MVWLFSLRKLEKVQSQTKVFSKLAIEDAQFFSHYWIVLKVFA